MCRNLIPEILEELDLDRVDPQASHRRALRTFPFWFPTIHKRHIGSGPGSFLVVCPDFTALQGSIEVAGESGQLKAAFSLLASSFIDLLY